MGLSRGWCGLLLFWACVVGLCGIGVVTLETLGPPPVSLTGTDQAEPTSIQANLASDDSALGPVAVPGTTETSASLAAEMLPDPTTFAPPETPVVAHHAQVTSVAQSDASLSDLRDAPPDPRVLVALETAATLKNAKVTSMSRSVLPPPSAAIAEALDRPNEPPPPDMAKGEKTVHLRITRDRRHCHQANCLSWHLMKHHAREPHASRIDLAGLHLAPDLRAAAESGKVDLIVDAVEQHETIKGRSVTVLVATDLAGVRSRGGSP